jgi:hypothetical protein
VVQCAQEDAVEAVRKLNGGKGVDYVVECSGAPNAVNEAIRMVNRGGKVCLAAFPHEETPVDVAHIVRNNIYLYGIRGEGKSATHRAEAFMSQKRFDATKVHTHTFPARDLPTAIRYAKDRVEDAIKGGGEGARRIGCAKRARRSEVFPPPKRDEVATSDRGLGGFTDAQDATRPDDLNKTYPERGEKEKRTEDAMRVERCGLFLACRLALCTAAWDARAQGVSVAAPSRWWCPSLPAVRATSSPAS